MADQQDVELRIRATNYSKKPLDQVVAALKDMTDAQAAQIESAKKGEATADQLSASYKKIENAVKALLGQQALTKEFESQSAALAALKDKVDAARAAQKAFADGLPVGAERTKKQQDALNKLGNAVTAVEKQYLKTEARVAKTTQTMADAGIAAATLAASQQKIRDAVTTANAALERQERALDSMDGWAKQKADADKAAAAQARAAAARDAADAEAMTDAQRLADLEQLFTREVNKRTAAIRAQQQALEAAAAQAERLTRASNTTSRGRTPVVDAGLAGQIRDIQNPADAAVRSVAGIESAVKKLETRVREIRGPVQDYRGALEETKRAQAALAAVAGNVDAFTRQKAAVVAARYEYTQARTAVNALITEMRSGAAGADITTRLAQAQRTMQQSAQTLGNLTTQAHAAREALRLAGIDTRNLTQAEAQLVAQAQRATQALNQLTQAHQRNGAAGDQAGSRIFNWFGGSGGRTTLSFAQRFRGEVLALGASFVGLNAAIGLGQTTLNSYKANQAIMSRLLIANGGDARQAGLDFEYLEKQADRIGFVFQKIAPAFTKFAIAAKSANFTTQETRFVFESIAESAVKARLSTEELEGVFKAFEQIMSKGTIQAEELKGQLGDRLPGAFQIAARAAGKTVAEYTKMMELGEVSADQVIGIARELAKTYGTVSDGTVNLLAAEARFENAANRFRTSTAEGGFVEAYTSFLEKMTALLDGGDGDRLAQQLSAGFSAVIGIIETLVENIDALKFSVGALIAIGLLKWLVSLPALYRAVMAEVVLLNGTMVTLNTTMGVRGAAAAAALAAGATGATGAMARLTLITAGATRGLVALYGMIPLIGAVVLAVQGIAYAVEKSQDKVRANIVDSMKSTLKATQEADAAQEEYRAAQGTKEEAELKKKYDRLSNIARDAIFREQRIVAAARERGIDFEPLRAQAQASIKAATPVKGTEDPGNRPEDQLKKLRADLEREDKKSEKNMRSQRLKSAKEELKERLAIVDEAFQNRRDQATKDIKNEAQLQEALKLINASSLKAQAVERAKFNNEQASKSKESGSQRIRQEEAVAERLAKIQEDLANKEGKADPTIPYAKRREAAVAVVSKAYRELENDIAKYAKANPKQAASDLARTAELKKQAQILAGQNSDRKEAERLADDFNDAQTVLTTRIKEINDLYEAGRITAEQQRADTIAAVDELTPGVVAAGEAALEFAERFRKIMDPVAFQTLVSGIRTGLVSANSEAMTAGANLAAQQARLNTLLDEQKNKLDSIKTQRELNIITSEQERDLTNQVTEDYKQSILETVAALQTLLDKTREVGGMSEESYRKATAAAAGLTLETANSVKAQSDLDKVIVNSVASNGVTAFESLASSIADVATGAQSIGEGFRGALTAVAQFFAQLLRDIALAIIKQSILNAITAAMGGAGGGAGGTIANTLFHSGGVVGRGKGVVRELPREAFNNAMRYHTGGLAGFRPNEVPAILERNEEVLTRDDPRHVLNGGTRPAGGGGGSDAGNKFVLLDDRSNVTEAMQSSAGEKVTMVHLKNNLSTIKAMLR